MVSWVLRIVVAAALLGSAGVHYFLWTQDYPGLVGPLFLLDAIAGLVLAIAVLAWRHWLPALGAAGFGALTLGAYVLAATVGFMGNHGEDGRRYPSSGARAWRRGPGSHERPT